MSEKPSFITRIRAWANGESLAEDSLEEIVTDAREPGGFFSTELTPDTKRLQVAKEALFKLYDPPTFKGDNGEAIAMDGIGLDSAGAGGANKQTFNAQRGIPDAIFCWYLSQGFIGVQSCALISQQWLINKACNVPGKAAAAAGYELNFPEGTDEADIDDDIITKLRQTDKDFKVKENLIEYEKMNRVFGYRLMLFAVRTTDPDYYKNPFNLDGIKKGSYMGMAQIDPNWVAPILTETGVSDPASPDFYEPEYWQVSGKAIHKSHFALVRYAEVPDILKPTYQYGGLPLTQLIYERVYAAERTANEAPLLAMTKRVTGLKVDMAAAMSDEAQFQKNIEAWVQYRDNYGIKVMDREEDMVQLDTSLGDLDAVVMSQYQLVAAIANVPVVELLGTTPKGFQSTGEFEMKSYNKELKEIQANDFTPVLERHYQMVMKSKFEKVIPFDVYWNAPDAPTEKEKAEIEFNKSGTTRNYVDGGIISTEEAREKLRKDRDNGWNDLEEYNDDLGDPDENEDPFNLFGLDNDDLNLGYVSVRPRRSDQERLYDMVRYGAGIEDCIEVGDFHVTLMYSENKTPLEVGKAALNTEARIASPTGEVRLMGDGEKRALVMILESEDLRKRHEELAELGMEHSYPEYIPHISLKYKATPEDLQKILEFMESEESGHRWNRVDSLILDDERWNPTN